MELLFDDKGKAKLRTTGQKVEYIDPESIEVPDQYPSPWFDFVERCYESGDMSRLSHRTSRDYGDASLEACERVGTLFEAIDHVQRFDCQTMIEVVTDSLLAEADGVEAEAHEELILAIERHLPGRFGTLAIHEARELYSALIEMWRQPGRLTAFAQPLLMRIVIHLAALEPLEAARLLAGSVEEIDQRPDGTLFASTIDEVLTRFLMWVERAPQEQRDEATTVARRWMTLRPDCETAKRIGAACQPQSVDSPGD